MAVPTVFVSYSHHDEVWKDQLICHLQVLGKQGIVDVWDDRRIGAGDNWRHEIEQAMVRARAAILLVSADYLSSDFVLNEEIPRLLRRRHADGLRVVPVLVRPCHWRAVDWLTEMQLLPSNGRAISSGSRHDIDSDFASIAKDVSAILTSPAVPPRDGAGQDITKHTRPVGHIIAASLVSIFVFFVISCVTETCLSSGKIDTKTLSTYLWITIGILIGMLTFHGSFAVWSLHRYRQLLVDKTWWEAALYTCVYTASFAFIVPVLRSVGVQNFLPLTFGGALLSALPALIVIRRVN